MEHPQLGQVLMPQGDGPALSVALGAPSVALGAPSVAAPNSDTGEALMVRARELYESGDNVAAIHAKLQVPVRTVYHWVQKFRWSRRQPLNPELMLQLRQVHEERVVTITTEHYAAIESLLGKVRDADPRNAAFAARALKDICESLRLFQPLLADTGVHSGQEDFGIEGLQPSDEELQEVAQRVITEAEPEDEERLNAAAQLPTRKP